MVGTPGRLLDLAQQGHLQLGGLSVLVLDEADEMLDLGFLPDIERILRQIPDDRQSMLFSATMPGPIITLARTFMNQPTHIRAEAPHSAATHDTTEQFVYRAHALDKVEMVTRILQADGRGATMVFTRTKRTAQKVADELAERGFKVGAVHGDLNQVAREKALKAFRTGDVDVLVATDVAARGIDIDDVTHVINYQIPEDEQAYVHRIGRTGRAGKTGVAVTLVDWDELPRWSMIDKALGLDSPDPAETYSSSPHLYAELGIPAEARGTVGTPRKSPVKRRDAHGDAATSETPAKSARSRSTSRSRRRTRGGQPVTGHPNGSAAATGDAAAERRRTPVGQPRPAPPSASQADGIRSGRRPPRTRRLERTAADAWSNPSAGPRAISSPPRRSRWSSPRPRRSSGGRPTPGPPSADRPPSRRPTRLPPGRCRPRLRQLWTAPSPATTAPVVVGGTVATGNGRRVDGRDAGTGESRWSYARDTDLCGLSWVYHYAVAVYRDDRGCGQVSTLDGSTGRRGAARSSYADPQVRLSSDGTTVLSAGDTRLELWRSDMVRMLAYGETDARVKPSARGLHSGCTLVSAAASSSAVSVLEALRQPGRCGWCCCVRARKTTNRSNRSWPSPGSTPVRVPACWPSGRTTPRCTCPASGPASTWWTRPAPRSRARCCPRPPSKVGGRVAGRQPDHLVDRRLPDGLRRGQIHASLHHRRGRTKAPLGPGVMMAGRLLVPVTGAIGVYDPLSGANERYIPVDRAPGTAAVVPAVAGSRVFEQRGDTVVALG